ncbi:U-box domain-containing protein 35 [Striga hermonthica]|uniref:RING-type E3 ubiquitin transferase n=1 Tax=Striga hermonthica TaxID=68872 RepID=A0A9N7NTI9_STRHE|nr:U-box domain-containing protein 35 [Striga hermonthica]
MNGKNIDSNEGLDELPSRANSVAAVGISASKKSKYVLSWALEKFVPEGYVYFKLVHVHPVISRIPTPMGNYIPISQVREDIASAFKKEMESQITEKLLPYKKMCSQRKVKKCMWLEIFFAFIMKACLLVFILQVQVEIVQIESDDVGTAISGYIQKHKINKLVIGTSSRSMFSRAQMLSSKISECCPAFCSVYAVSKGKLSSMKPSDSETNRGFEDDSSETSCSSDNSSSLTLSSQAGTFLRFLCNFKMLSIEQIFRQEKSSFLLLFTTLSEWTVKDSFSKLRSASLPEQRFQALSAINHTLLHKRIASNIAMHPRSLLVDNSSNVSHATNQARCVARSRTLNASWDQISNSATLRENQANINLELEKLRSELTHIRGMYAVAQGEAIEASRKLSELEKRRVEEENNLNEISLKEEEAKELARQEKRRYEDAKKEAEFIKECAKREAAERKEAEMRASRKTNEKEKLESALNGSFNQYRPFTWEEIVSATSSFSDSLKIGMGAYGTVYKCSFQHTIAAAKILHAKEASRNKQFRQELEILSKIRHPHLLILLGACPEHSCLVYEFMENGSLEDRIFRKNATPPLPWPDRFRIAHEVASALVFLHEAKPKSIIHRDLKPANILLDRNLVSKIGDVGLSTMVSCDPLSLPATYSDNGLVGTLCYIDPEYQRTGVVSPKSDVYAFGMVVLQLLTGKPAIALTHAVESAAEEGRLVEVLDQEGGQWPEEETRELAMLGLKCTEMRQRDRPDLREEVLPVLERLREFAEKARNLGSVFQPPPKHFICPIVKEVMADPCVAGDGYTYDRRAIETWLEEKDASPVTGLPLPHKYLTPNYTLLSAIIEWKSGKQT